MGKWNIQHSGSVVAMILGVVGSVAAQESAIPGISGLPTTEAGSSTAAGEPAVGSTGTAEPGVGSLPDDLGFDGSQKVRAGDSIVVRVLDEPLVSGSFTVGRDGRINYPLLGKIAVEGSSLDEIAQGIESLLEKDYIRDAEVATAMSNRKESSVIVHGAVRQQGQISFDPDAGLTLGSAMARAGGADANADPAKVEIQRADGDGSAGVRKNLNADQAYPLNDGDIVIVHPKPQAVPVGPGGGPGGAAEQVPMGRVVVTGQVNREGIVSIPERGVDILEVIVMSGGFTRLAWERKTIVRRPEADGTVSSKTVDVDKIRKGEVTEGFLILPGDTIFVKESPW